jgi:hypothetical protein
MKYEVNVLLNKERVSDVGDCKVSIDSDDSPDIFQDKLKLEYSQGAMSFMNYNDGKIIIIPSKSIFYIESSFSAEEHLANVEKMKEDEEGMVFFTDNETKPFKETKKETK